MITWITRYCLIFTICMIFIWINSQPGEKFPKFVTIFFILKKNCVFFTLPFPYSPSPLQSPHCCPCPWVLFLFALFLHLLTSPTNNHHPPLYESVSILPVNSVCSLDSIYEWNHIWYLSFPDWLISLSIMCSRSTHAVTGVKFSFFPVAK